MEQTESQGNLKQKISRIPILGYLLRLAWQIIYLPKQTEHMYKQLRILSEQSRGSNELIRKNASQASTEILEINNQLRETNDQIADLKHRILAIKVGSGTTKQVAAGTNDLLADDHDLDDFYMKFENKFRGTENEIKQRLEVYVPKLKKLNINFNKYPLLDIGCGRGELLDLMKEKKIRAIGLDLNESMVQRCADRGFEAVQADALQYLMNQEPNSLGAITGFHIVEHIPFSFLLRLFEECQRVLVPGGVVIFETPNPESLHVGSFSFYYDPSHLHPIAPDVLAFAIENRGFNKAEILRLHPKGDGRENDKRDDTYISEVLRRFYMEQDYAVIGYKI